jgi:hypothetical protein
VVSDRMGESGVWGEKRVRCRYGLHAGGGAFVR